MKLSQYINDNPDKLLADAIAYDVTVDTKQVGSGQARGYLVNTSDIWKKLKVIQADITHDLFSLADAIITTASDAQSYFGMDETKADGVANRIGITILVQAGIMTQLEADNFIAKTLSITYPLASTTQPEFDAAKADLATVGKTNAVVSYDQIDSLATFTNRRASTKTAILITLAAPVTYLTKFKVFVSKQSPATGAWNELTRPVVTVEIKAGLREIDFEIERFHASRTKFRIESDRVDPLTALVTSVSKYN